MRTFLFILFWIITSVLCVWIPAETAEEQQLIEMVETGRINWSRWSIQAKGIGAPSGKTKSNATQMALIAAKQEARKKILAVVKNIRVDSTSVVRDHAMKSDVVMAKIVSLIRDAKVLKQNYLSDGTAEVIMEMSLLGGFSQLILPQEIKQIESIKTTAPPQGKPDPFTGLIVDARKIGVKPAMIPRILNENGEEVFGPAFISRECAVQHGSSGYINDLAAAQRDPRVASHPLTVKGLRANAKRSSEIIISNADSSRLKSASEHLSFLKKCRVMVVIDK